MDRRDEILCKEFDPSLHVGNTIKDDLQIAIILNPDIDKIYNAMDENGKRLCLELLEYMAKNEVSCEVNMAKEKRFYFKGQWISKEELFENFL